MRGEAPPRADQPPGALEITEVRIRLAQDGREDILKAYVSITVNDCLAIHNLKIIQGGRGLFVSMPARRNKTGGFSDIVHPIHQDFRDHLEDVVISAYWRELGHPVEDGADAEVSE
jgi:stage V sporulation protein G